MQMTIAEAKAAVAALNPHNYTDAEIIAWLSEIDTNIYWRLVRKVNPYDAHDPDKVYAINDLISHKNTPYKALASGVLENPDDAPASWAEETWAAYAPNIVPSTVLLAPVPYDIPLYLHWLSMQISLYNKEMAQYNNEAVLYNIAWQNLADHLNRTFPPVAKATHFSL
jgi:hypothetical protein